MGMLFVTGAVVKHRSCSKYLCYNSFAASYYWGGKANVEIFPGMRNERLESVLKELPEGIPVVYGSKDSELEPRIILQELWWRNNG
jgi:hypothetical protein